MYALQIPSWFPDEENPYTGNFIEKHITSIALYFPVITIRVVGVEKLKMKRLKEEGDNETTITYFYRKNRSILGRIVAKLCRSCIYRKAIKDIQREFGPPGLIHLHVAYPMGRFAVKWARKWDIPLLLTEHWSIYQPQNRHKITSLMGKHLNFVHEHIKAYTAVSENLRQAIATMFPAEKSWVVPNVVDTDLFHLSVGSNSGKKNIIHISTLDDDAKNFSGILNAIRRVAAQRNDFVLYVIHENRHEDAEAFVKHYALSDVIHFLGRKSEEEVALHLQKSDFLLLFSNYENLPCVIIEAFACGKPVLTTPVGGIPEIVDSSRGIFVNVKDEDDLVVKLNEMLERSEKYDAHKIREYAESHFSKKIIGEKFFEIYQEIANFSGK